MKSLKPKIFTFLLALFFFSVLSFSGLTDKKEDYIVQASILDIIRALVTINPLGLDVTAPTEAEINKVFKVEAVAINKGGDKIENAKAEIFLPAGLVLLRKDPVQNMGVIRGRKEKKASWSVKGDSAGVYIISVLVSGELRGDIVSADATAKITLKEKPSPPGSFLNVFQRFFEAFQRLFRL
ncbi:hypothetical protein IID24_02275 [Patescibacteria group bacterium]|nr:hypothetical protein [Patescibacteria group bacterium]